ncbi:MAG: HNH endonuclease [Proteobacteria bacterium]|nr:MAG: HNH endonuclease [Pseudomonadota bacterium]
MTNQELEIRLESLVSQERVITREILQLILLAEDRKLYLARGFDSLVRWLVGQYKYSETAALRRVNAARMLRSVPAATGKIESGELNLTTMAKAQSVIYAEEKRTGEKMPATAKAAVATAIVNKSLSSAERTLAELFPEATKKLEETRVVDRGSDEVRISITLPREAYELILKVQAALRHAMPEADLAEITAHVYEDYWKRKNPQREVRTVKRSATAAVAPCTSDGIPASTKRLVFRRDDGRCQFVDRLSKRKCLSTRRVQVDHIIPRALGGTNDPENLRCLCRAHNAYRAEKTFGPQARAVVH